MLHVRCSDLFDVDFYLKQLSFVIGSFLFLSLFFQIRKSRPENSALLRDVSRVEDGKG
jgi:hypothetical protein